MPTVEPTKKQLAQQRQAPPQKDARAVETAGQHRDPNAANVANVANAAMIERIQKDHLGSSHDEHRKARAP